MAANLLLGDVKEGAEMPVLEKDVKPVTVVLGARASKLMRETDAAKLMHDNRLVSFRCYVDEGASGVGHRV